MKTKLIYFLLPLMLLVFLPGCEVIEGIFKAGVWVGILIVVGIIGLIAFIASKAMKK